MKKQSVAEQTLNKQIKNIDTQIANLREEEAKLKARLSTLREVQDNLTTEVQSLRDARIAASESRK